MTRPLRIEFSGALYHVTSRGNERRRIVRDDADRHKWIDSLRRTVETGEFLRHEGCQPHATKDLACHRLNTWRVAPRPGGGAPNVTCNEGETRAHLCLASEREEVDERQIRRYYENRHERRLPHFRTYPD